MGKSKVQTSTQALDPASQRYVDQMRAQAQGGQGVIQGGSFFTGPQTMSIADQAAQFMNPYQHNVIDALGSQYDHLRAGAATDVAQQATAAGAYGGSRAAIANGARMGELDRSQMGQTADLLNSGYQSALGMGTQYAEQQRQLRQQQMMEPIWKQQQMQALYQGGMGPVGGTTTQIQKGNLMGDIVGVGMTALGAYSGLHPHDTTTSNPGGGMSFGSPGIQMPAGYGARPMYNGGIWG